MNVTNAIIHCDSMIKYDADNPLYFNISNSPLNNNFKSVDEFDKWLYEDVIAPFNNEGKISVAMQLLLRIAFCLKHGNVTLFYSKTPSHISVIADAVKALMRRPNFKKSVENQKFILD
jgi:hypothetical protein